jgi:hypothetical protein
MAEPASARAAPPPDGVDRITSADIGVLLERLAATNLVDRGSVTILSVQSIADRAGPRWPRRRDDVWAYVERKCDEHLSFQDVRHRISETDFLIAIMAEEGIAAQSISLKVLEEVLIFFLGAAEASDLKVRAVTAIEGDMLATAEIDLARIAEIRKRPTGEPCHGDVDPQERRKRTPVSFVTAAGERVRVDFSLEQVVNLQHRVTSARRIQPTVTSLSTGRPIPVAAFPKLADEDIAFIDRSALAFGALFLPADVRNEPPLIVPASFRTMGGRRGREALMSVEGASLPQIRQGLMLEFVDIDLGTPTARLAEVAGLVDQICRSVLGRIRPGRDALEPIRGVRFQGLTFDPRDLRVDEPRLAVLVRQMAVQSRGKAPAVICQGLPDAAWLKRAHVAGFTHAAIQTSPLTAPAD